MSEQAIETHEFLASDNDDRGYIESRATRMQVMADVAPLEIRQQVTECDVITIGLNYDE